MLKIKEIREKYGNETLNKIRQHEKLAKTLGRFRSHLHFGLQCKHSQLIPKTLKINHHTTSSEANDIIRRAERALLNIRISENLRKIARLRAKLQTIESDLSTILDQNDSQNMLDLDKQRENKALHEASISQKRKYLSLKGIRSIRTQENRPEEHEDQPVIVVTEETNIEPTQIRRSTRNKITHNYRNLHMGIQQHDETTPIQMEIPTTPFPPTTPIKNLKNKLSTRK